MSKITKQNVGGTNYTMAGCALTGVCASAAADYVKVVTLSDGDELSDGMTVIVAFANGNTTGTAPAVKTIYSSDQVNYFTDSGLTQPFTLAPAGCYEIEYTGTGNVYNYISYPVLQIGSVSAPLCDASGKKASGSLWLAGDKVSITYSGGTFNVIPQTASAMTVMAASSVVNGAPIRVGSTVRILFTQNLAGANTSTGLVLTYNGVGIPVMVGKNGSLGAFTATDVGSSTYKYLQAYTTLEMAYDGTQLIILGNPAVISNADYTVYTDGSTAYRNIVESLLLPTTCGNLETKTTLNNRKISKYKYLLINYGLGAKDIRDTILVLRDYFENNYTVTLNFNTSGNNYYWGQIKYVSDTSFSIEGSGNYIEILGIKA